MPRSERERRIEVRAYRHGDEQGLSEITANFTGRLFSEDYWRWKFQQGPDGEAISRLALDGKRVVALVAAIPHRFEINSGDVIGACVTHALRLPGYETRGGGWLKVARQAYLEGEKSDVSLFYGITNRVTQVASRAVGFHSVGAVIDLRRPLDFRYFFGERVKNQQVAGVLGAVGNLVLKLVYRTGKPKLPAGWRLSDAKGFDARFDRLWQTIKDEFPVCVARNSSYLNWRYKDTPDILYEIIVLEDAEGRVLGFVVLRADQRETGLRGHIVDLVASPQEPQVYGTLIRAAVERFRSKRAAVVHCWMLPHVRFYKSFRRLGFLPTEAQRFLVLRAVDLPPEVLKRVNKIREWYVTKGDFELL